MARYYFPCTALPPLQLGSKPELGFKQLQSLLDLNLTPADAKKLRFLLWPIDLRNIKALWMGLPLDELGVHSAKDLEEILLVKDRLPSYLLDFLERYESTQERLRYFSSLYASLYRQEFDGFLAFYFTLEREVRLVLLALRAKKAKRDIAFELQFEALDDPLVAQILAQKDTPDYSPPVEYEDLKAIFLSNQDDPRKLAYALMKYRFDKIEEYEETEHFTIDQILAYAARLLIVEGWEKLSQEHKSTALEELSRYG